MLAAPLEMTRRGAVYPEMPTALTPLQLQLQGIEWPEPEVFTEAGEEEEDDAHAPPSHDLTMTLEDATRLLTSHNPQYLVSHALGLVANWDNNKTRTRRAMKADHEMLAGAFR